MPDIPVSPVVLLVLQVMFVFLICEDLLMMKTAIELKKPFEVLTRVVRFLFFTAITFALVVIGFATSTLLGVVHIILAIIEIAAIFILLPRIGRAISGSISDALMGAIIVLFGMGTSAISVMAKNYGALLPGAAITATGGWMMYKAIKKMGEGE